MSEQTGTPSAPEFSNDYFTLDEAVAKAGKTWDDVPITQGLVVITNEMEVGLVDLSRLTPYSEWFDVIYADGGRVLQDSTRVATTFRNYDGTRRVAETEWAQRG